MVVPGARGSSVHYRVAVLAGACLVVLQCQRASTAPPPPPSPPPPPPGAVPDPTQLPIASNQAPNPTAYNALNVPGLPVDRHVLRVSNRLGIADSNDPVVVEDQLCRALPAEQWTRASDTLILHGRRVCRPRPACDQCVVQSECAYYAGGGSDAREEPPRRRRAVRGRQRPRARRPSPAKTGRGAAARRTRAKLGKSRKTRKR